MSKDEPRRQRDARKDASVGSIEKHIEDTYGLPPGSVQITNTDGSNARSDQKIGTLRRRYEK
jgi:ribosomal protein L23